MNDLADPFGFSIQAFRRRPNSSTMKLLKYAAAQTASKNAPDCARDPARSREIAA